MPDFALPVAGAGLGIGGAYQQYLGSQQQQGAMSGALGQYGQQLGQFYQGQQNANLNDAAQGGQVSQDRMAALQQMLAAYGKNGGIPQTAAPTAAINGAVAQARSGGPQLGDPSMTSGGPATDLGNRLGENYGKRLGEQTAVGANTLGWGQQGLQQQGAMAGFAAQDQTLANRLAMLNRLAAIRGGADQRSLAQIEQNAQGQFNYAQGQGQGHMLTGAVMGGLGTLLGAFGGGRGGGSAETPGATGTLAGTDYPNSFSGGNQA